MAAVLPSPITSTDYAPHPTNKMKAARWMGRRDVEISLVPKPTITDPSDAIIQVTHCTISGSDLPLYEGDLGDAMRKGDIMGREAIGLVEEVGPNVNSLEVGDRVIILPVIACGHCDYCKRNEYSLCDVSNPSKEMQIAYGHRVAGILGHSQLCGGYPGNQAEFCRVPNADLTCLKAPHDVDARKLLSLSDVVSTAWHALELAEVRDGDAVGVWGCSPIGLSIQRLAKLRGANMVYAIDRNPQRLQRAEEFGMIPIDVSAHSDVGEYLLSIRPQGVDKAIEASGYPSTQQLSLAAMRALGLGRESSDPVSAIIKATRKGGNIALVGDFFFTTHDFPVGPLVQKALTVRGGQSIPQRYQPFLLDLVISGRLDPSWMFTYEDSFENIAAHYRRFAQHEEPGGLKVVLVTAFGRSEQPTSDILIDRDSGTEL